MAKIAYYRDMTKKSMPKRRKSLPTQRTVIKRRVFYAIPNAKRPNANSNAKKPNANPNAKRPNANSNAERPTIAYHTTPLSRRRGAGGEAVGEGLGVRLSERGRGWGLGEAISHIIPTNYHCEKFRCENFRK